MQTTIRRIGAELELLEEDDPRLLDDDRLLDERDELLLDELLLDEDPRLLEDEGLLEERDELLLDELLLDDEPRLLDDDRLLDERDELLLDELLLDDEPRLLEDDRLLEDRDELLLEELLLEDDPAELLEDESLIASSENGRSIQATIRMAVCSMDQIRCPASRDQPRPQDFGHIFTRQRIDFSFRVGTPLGSSPADRLDDCTCREGRQRRGADNLSPIRCNQFPAHDVPRRSPLGQNVGPQTADELVGSIVLEYHDMVDAFQRGQQDGAMVLSDSGRIGPESFFAVMG